MKKKYEIIIDLKLWTHTKLQLLNHFQKINRNEKKKFKKPSFKLAKKEENYTNAKM